MRKKNDPEKEVAVWNARVKVGDMVEYIDHPGAEPMRTTTCTEAEVLSGHTAVLWLAGKRGCVCVSHCTPIPA